MRWVEPANVSDSMQRLSADGAALRSTYVGGLLRGPGTTAETRAGGDLPLQIALNLAMQGT